MTSSRAGTSLRGVVLWAVVLAAGCGAKETPLSQLTPTDLWQRGMAQFEERKWDEAIRYLDRFVLVGGADPRVNQARYHVAQARFNKREYVTAAAEFSRLASDLGRADLAEDARFMACRSYEELAPRPQLDQEYTRAAIDHCSALVDFFPNSEFAPPATEIVQRMQARLAEKVYTTGEWYFGRRAYDSAIIYFEDVTQRYPGTPWAPRSLARLVEIYDRLGYEEERQEVRRRLLSRYPTSPEARALRTDA